MTRHQCYQEAECWKHKKEIHLDLKNLYTVSHHRHPQLNLQFLKHAETYKEECVNQLGSMHESENYFSSVHY
jgi:hypothetical protein